MGNVLVHTPEENITVPAQAARRLLERGDGDAALLYLALLRHHGNTPPRALAGELRWERGRIETAEETLRQLGLVTAAPEEREAPPAPAEEKPTYQRSDILDRLEGSAEFRQLVAEVERRLGKKLTVPDTGILLGLQDYLGLPPDVIYLLVCHCAQTAEARYGPGRRPAMRQIEREGYAWARKGIDSQRAAAEYLRACARRQEAVPAYMRALNLGERPPSPSEAKYLDAWQEMGFPPEAVAIAYDRTVLKCHELKWPYCNGILRKWHQEGLHTPEEIRAGDRPGGRQPEERQRAASHELQKYMQELHRDRR